MSFEQTLVEHCAPVLAGIKPANLFRYSPEDPKQFALEYRVWKERFALRGLRLTVLKEWESGYRLIYLYRAADLETALSQPGHQAFLCTLGYPRTGDLSACLQRLSRRLYIEKEFPHEIGVFLGYPLEDVKGFIRHRGRNCTCSGCWKAYGDLETAWRTFTRLRKCTETYRKRYASGIPITQLVVAA